MPLQKRVGELPAVATIVGTDQLIVSSANATKRCTVTQIGAFFQANGVAGPPGPQGPSGASNWSEIVGKPSTFPPSTHSHVAADISDFSTAAVAAVTWSTITGKPSTFAPSAHGHAISDVTGLQSALDGKQVAGSYAALVHTHGISDVTGLQSALDGKAASSHTHTIANVTGLQSALDAKATPADVTSAVAAVVNAAPATLDTLAELAAALGSDANFSTTVTNALAAKAPLASPTFTGTVSGITKAMVGLGNVDNTADASKPVSTAQAAADTAVASAAAADATSKANAAQAAAVQRANHTGTQAWSTITGTPTTLAGYGITNAATSVQFEELSVNLQAYAESLSMVAFTGSASDLEAGTVPFARLPVGTTSTSVAVGNDSRFTDARTPLSHAHGNITNAGAIGSTSGQIVVTTTSGVLTTAANLGWSLISSTPTTLSGYGITDAVASSDSRLTNARTPTAHKSTHATGGADALSPADIGAAAVFHTHSALTDITGLATVATSGSYNDLTNKPTIPSAYTLPTASATVLGGVRIGSGISIDGSGVISASAGYTLPNATTSTLGGVIVGAGLGVSSGTISVTYGTASGTACQGNDARLSDTRTPTDGSVTDAKITSGGLSASVLNWAAITAWAADTAYAKGDLVSFQGIAYRRSAAGTSGATFNASNWQQITPSEFVGSQITSGTIPVARLGTGSPSSANFLRGDGTFASAGSTSASDLVSGTLANARLTTRVRASANLYLWSSFR